MGRLILAAAVVATAMVAAGAQAADTKAAGAAPMPMAMPMSGTPTSGMTDAMQKMEKAMAAAPMTGDADQDFVAMMIPHHQGAIDMAIWELDHGHDPKMRKLAASIVKAQENEIALMQAWQEKHAK